MFRDRIPQPPPSVNPAPGALSPASLDDEVSLSPDLTADQELEAFARWLRYYVDQQEDEVLLNDKERNQQIVTKIEEYDAAMQECIGIEKYSDAMVRFNRLIQFLDAPQHKAKEAKEAYALYLRYPYDRILLEDAYEKFRAAFSSADPERLGIIWDQLIKIVPDDMDPKKRLDANMNFISYFFNNDLEMARIVKPILLTGPVDSIDVPSGFPRGIYNKDYIDTVNASNTRINPVDFTYIELPNLGKQLDWFNKKIRDSLERDPNEIVERWLENISDPDIPIEVISNREAINRQDFRDDHIDLVIFGTISTFMAGIASTAYVTMDLSDQEAHDSSYDGGISDEMYISLLVNAAIALSIPAIVYRENIGNTVAEGFNWFRRAVLGPRADRNTNDDIENHLRNE